MVYDQDGDSDQFYIVKRGKLSIQIMIEIESHNAFPCKRSQIKGSEANDLTTEESVLSSMQRIDEEDSKEKGKKEKNKEADGKKDAEKDKNLWKIVKTKKKCIYKVRELRPGEIFGHDEFVDHFENVMNT